MNHIPPRRGIPRDSISADNALVRKIDAETKSRLDVAQKAWVGYRDAECSYQAPAASVACITQMNMARAVAFEDEARIAGDKDNAANELDWKRGKLGHLSQFVGTYRYEAILAEPDVKQALVNLAGSDATEQIQANLESRSPIAMIDSNLVLSGLAPHQGMSEEATLMVNLYDGSIRAALLHKEKLTIFARDQWYWYIPQQLRDFVRRPAAFKDIVASLPREEEAPPQGVQWVK